jgi:hypothetical protein
LDLVFCFASEKEKKREKNENFLLERGMGDGTLKSIAE